jgi:methylenetetrahydrofolate reductase (NADPH)
VPWDGPSAAVVPAAVPVILTDVKASPFDPADLAATASVLAPSCDVVLVGEHQHRADFPPTLMSTLLLDAAVQPWITLSCRDRNRIVLEQELRGLKSSALRRCVLRDR